MTQDTFPHDPPFERKIHKGLTTPRAYVSAVLEDSDKWSTFGVSDCANGYAEPGYDPPADGCAVLFGNWNPPGNWPEPRHNGSSPPERFAKIAEYAGHTIEWHDEWSTCDSCRKAIRTQADSYGWKRSYYETDNGIECAECTLQDPGGYLESLEDSPDRAVTLTVDPAEYGYVKIGDRFENGMHPGQNDSPQTIAKSLRAVHVHRFIFVIDDVGQFDVRFSLWVHNEEVPNVPQAIDSALPYDIATEIGKVLRGEHSNYYTSTTRLVTQEEFINGIK